MFIEEGRFYKGNIHSHTIISDGRLQVEESINAYKERGYSFLVISDHEYYFDSTEYDTDSFLVYPGIEWAVSDPKDGHKGHHIQGLLGTRQQADNAGDNKIKHLTRLEKFKWRSPHTIQKVIDSLNAAGNLAIYNHPVWSRLLEEDIVNVSNLFAIEIYNHNCEVEEGCGLATTLWDNLLRRGIKLYGVAADDNHNNKSLQSPYSDSFGGWIAVKATELSREAIAEALVQGSFYASSGPEIFDYTLEDKQVRVTCSPVKKIRFVSYERRGSAVIAEEGGYLTEAIHTLVGDEIFMRVECVDEQGRTAWSNPIFFDL